MGTPLRVKQLIRIYADAARYIVKAVLIVGWMMNAYALFSSWGEWDSAGEAIARTLGVLIPPIGGILGYI